MSQQVKTDNRSLDLKVQLRVQVLRKAGFTGGLRVLDLCAGQGHIWRRMLKEGARLDHYTPVDSAARMDATIAGDVMDDRFLAAFDPARYNVIDIDTYGEPWKPWRNLMERPLGGRTVFFLTHGAVSSPGGCNISAFAREALGIPADWRVPMKRDLAQFAAPYLLLAPAAGGRIIAGWKVCLPNVTYYGLICEPRNRVDKAGLTSHTHSGRRKVHNG